VISPRNDIVHPRDSPTGIATFVGLEHIEPNTGRRIGAVLIDLGSMIGRKARFLPGDIVYGYLRPYLNKVWIAEFAGFCSVDQYVFIVNETIADAAYVASYLRSPAYLAAAPIDETPGQLPRIRLDEVLSTPIPLLPLDEQRRIAAHLGEQLDTSDAMRLGVQSRLEALAQIRQEVLASTFARIEAPAIALGVAVSAPGAIADGPFGSHLKTEHYAPNGVRVIRLQNIGSGVFLDHDRAFVTQEHAESLTRHSARRGDVIVAALGDGARPAGRACQVPDVGPALVKADCFRVRTDGAPVDPGFLVLFLNSPRTQATISGQMRGATRPRVTLAMLKAFTIPLPPLTEQRRIAARLREQLAEIDRAKAALEAQRKAVDALPAALLREVFSSGRPPIEQR
jgi:type I restriction enzyme S subunit